MPTGSLNSQRSVISQEQDSFSSHLEKHGYSCLNAGPVSTLQVNLGKICNQACMHCHVEAGPKRTETLSEPVYSRIVELLEASPDIETVDITGGAPEMSQFFRPLVEIARRLGKRVIDRCNLTILFEPGMEDLARFLKDNRVEITASLPCYSEKNVDAQRGGGTFNKSIDAIRLLNWLGYGQPRTELLLNLVYNPGGAVLPPAQTMLERTYKDRLLTDHGIEFNRLYTIANMPIRRFSEYLARSGNFESYHDILKAGFNIATVDGLMCRSQVNVSWDGNIYDCDFNQMAELPLHTPKTVWHIDSFSELGNRPIATARHCFGCTAGSGSSCGGAIR